MFCPLKTQTDYAYCSEAEIPSYDWDNADLGSCYYSGNSSFTSNSSAPANFQKRGMPFFSGVITVSITIWRYYTPELGRWVSRDPIRKKSVKNLYLMCHNSTFNKYDLLGLVEIQGTGLGVAYNSGDVIDKEYDKYYPPGTVKPAGMFESNAKVKCSCEAAGNCSLKCKIEYSPIIYARAFSSAEEVTGTVSHEIRHGVYLLANLMPNLIENLKFFERCYATPDECEKNRVAAEKLGTETIEKFEENEASEQDTKGPEPMYDYPDPELEADTRENNSVIDEEKRWRDRHTHELERLMIRTGGMRWR